MQSLGPIIADLEGCQLTPEEFDFLQHPALGGIILFARNYQDPAQVKDLTTAVHAVRPNLPIFVDQEGGRVQRFREGFTELPAMKHWTQLYGKDKHAAATGLKEITTVLANELKAVGVDASFIPVLDLDEGVSEIIGERSLGKTPEQVITLANVLIDVLHDLGMPVTGKHFPGHGSVVADSHLHLPQDERSLQKIENSDLVIYRELITKLDLIMTAHIVYPQVDELPATYSPYWLKTILRDRLGFEGLILSDDLSMAGAAIYPSFLERAKRALDAGCDMLLVCNDRVKANEVLAGLRDQAEANVNKRIDTVFSRYMKSTIKEK